jgi:hypothetical protein
MRVQAKICAGKQECWSLRECVSTITCSARAASCRRCKYSVSSDREKSLSFNLPADFQDRLEARIGLSGAGTTWAPIFEHPGRYATARLVVRDGPWKLNRHAWFCVSSGKPDDWLV